jgi:NAD(P)-dependent dehydrogenase (short-subunit alcohol dehydrogenase family)
VIVGAAHRCGTAIGRALALDDHDVALLSFTQLRSRAAKLEALGARALAVRLGTREPDDVAAITDAVNDFAAAADLLVHLAVGENAEPDGGLDPWSVALVERMGSSPCVVLVVDAGDVRVVRSILGQLEHLGATTAVILSDGAKPDDIATSVVEAAHALAKSQTSG